MNIKRSIKRGLEMNGENQKWLCDQTGWLPSYVSMLATGDKGGSVATIKRLADAFGVPASEFIKWGEE